MGVLAALVGATLAAAPAAAWIPSAERVARAAARANLAADRDRPLALEVAVVPVPPEEGGVSAEVPPGGAEPPAPTEPLATGTLLTDGAGRARLELHHREGFRERHLRRGRILEAARDGEALRSPAPLLPPLEVLQAGSSGELFGWLATHGASRAAELGYVGPHDCIVLGGRGGGAALWVDQDSWEIVRVDTAAAQFHLGPPRAFEGVRLPAWIEVREPGDTRLRLEVRGVRTASPSAGAFAPEWLREPPPAPPAEPGPAPGGRAPDAAPEARPPDAAPTTP